MAEDGSPFSVFRHLAFERTAPPPTSEELAAIERALGAELPAVFVEFLRAGNGGTLEYVVDVPVGDGSTEALSFCSVFRTGLDDTEAGTFLYEVRMVREHAGAPKGVLPIARDGGGSTVFLDLSEGADCEVVAFVVGLPEWSGSKVRESMYAAIAPSFEAYVDRLRLDREALLDHLLHDMSEPQQVAATEDYLDIGLPDWRERDEELVEAVAAARERIAAG